MSRFAMGVAIGGTVMGLTAVVGTASADDATTVPAPARPVAEVNVDEDGNIKVHEQGTVEATVLNLPLTEDGELRTSGELSVSGPVGIDPAANAVTLDQASLDALAGLVGTSAAEERSPTLWRSPINSAPPSSDSFEADDHAGFVVTDLSIVSEGTAIMTFSEHLESNRYQPVHQVFAGPGQAVNLSFDDLLRAERADVTCRAATPCTVRWAMNGYWA